MVGASSVLTVEQYLLADYPRTLFPLSTTSLLVERSADLLKQYVSKLVGPNKSLPGFPAQQRCYAAKKGHSLRRTVKLDPASEFFIYDLVLRNRRSFRADHRPTVRRSFGYRFKQGRPESITESYGEFKSAVAKSRERESLTLKADVAAYFNSIYHHDLVNTARDIRWPEPDVEALGQFLREIAAGRSVDCLPQGIHPCKVLGSEFLRFVDNSFRLRSRLGLRFLDDLHFFDDDERVLTADWVKLQELLGERGLSLNDSKTSLGAIDEIDVPQAVDEMKAGLLQLRRTTISVSDDESIEEDDDEKPGLDEAQVEYLLDLVKSPDIDESDAELVLVLLRDHSDEVLPKLPELLSKYPGLSKNLHHYARLVEDQTGLVDIIREFLDDSPNATEYQLFWLAKVAEDFLSKSRHFGHILNTALDHPNASLLSRAKVLEIPTKRFGLPELREEVLRSGRSDWEAWAAAAGTRAQVAGQRNHLLGYFAKGSPLNELIAACVRRHP